MVFRSPVEPQRPVLAALEQRRRVMITARSLERWSQLVGTMTKLLAITGLAASAGMLLMKSPRVAITSTVAVLIVSTCAWILGRLIGHVGEAFRTAAEIDDPDRLVVALRLVSRYTLLFVGGWVVVRIARLTALVLEAA